MFSMAGYYGWAYNPWVAPVYYGWGWAEPRGYGYYGGYSRPIRCILQAAFWLTDYLISANLQAAYAASGGKPMQKAAGAANNSASSDDQVASTGQPGAAPSGQSRSRQRSSKRLPNK